MKYHLFAHNDKNLVKVGDKVEKYKTPIGTIGTANESYPAHLHHSISEGLTVAQLRSYIKGWTKEKVQKYYIKPDCNYEKMFGKKMDVGNRGWGWLDDIGGGFHPGLDINGLGGGNTDVGYEYKSDCDGVVIYVSETKSKDGWGKMVIIEEEDEVVLVGTGSTETPKEIATEENKPAEIEVKNENVVLENEEINTAENNKDNTSDIKTIIVKKIIEFLLTKIMNLLKEIMNKISNK